MSVTRTPTITTRLFPLDSDYVAVSAVRSDELKDFNATYAITKQDYRNATTKKKRGGLFSGKETVTTEREQSYSLQGRSISLESHFAPCILPSGYYFKDQTYYTSDEGMHAPKHRIDVSNITSDDHGGLRSIEEKLDTSLITMTHDSPSRRQLIGVSEDRKSLYFYELTPSTARIINCITNESQFSTEFELQGFDDADGNTRTGHHICTFEGDTQIVSIAGFPRLPEHLLVMALNTGEITLCAAQEDRNYFFTLEAPTDKNVQTQLLATPQGLIMAYAPGATTLRTWDLTNPGNKNPVIQPIPKWHNLSVSVDGKYLTGLEDQDNGVSNTVHCYELPLFKHHVIKLKEPVADFVIGKDGRICTVTKSEKVDQLEIFAFFGGKLLRSYPGVITDFLPKPKAVSAYRPRFLSIFSKSSGGKDEQPKNGCAVAFKR